MDGEVYRDRAAECVRLAQLAQDNETKALLLKMAEAWLRLADGVGSHEPSAEPQ